MAALLTPTFPPPSFYTVPYLVYDATHYYHCQAYIHTHTRAQGFESLLRDATPAPDGEEIRWPGYNTQVPTTPQDKKDTTTKLTLAV